MKMRNFDEKKRKKKKEVLIKWSDHAKERAIKRFGKLWNIKNKKGIIKSSHSVGFNKKFEHITNEVYYGCKRLKKSIIILTVINVSKSGMLKRIKKLRKESKKCMK